MPSDDSFDLIELHWDYPLYGIRRMEPRAILCSEAEGQSCTMIYRTKELAELYIEQARIHSNENDVEPFQIDSDSEFRHLLTTLAKGDVELVLWDATFQPRVFKMVPIADLLNILKPPEIHETFSQARMDRCLAVGRQITDDWASNRQLRYRVRSEVSLQGKSFEELRRCYFSVGVGENLTDLPLVDLLVVFSWIKGYSEGQKKGLGSHQFEVKTAYTEDEVYAYLRQIEIETP